PDRGDARPRLAGRGGEHAPSRRGPRDRAVAVSPDVCGAGGVPDFLGPRIVAHVVSREPHGGRHRLLSGGVARRCARPGQRPWPRLLDRGPLARGWVDGAAAARHTVARGAVTAIAV